jgi:hypothetical protein
MAIATSVRQREPLVGQRKDRQLVVEPQYRFSARSNYRLKP